MDVPWKYNNIICMGSDSEKTKQLRPSVDLEEERRKLKMAVWKWESAPRISVRRWNCMFSKNANDDNDATQRLAYKPTIIYPFVMRLKGKPHPNWTNN